MRCSQFLLIFAAGRDFIAASASFLSNLHEQRI
jgi:hypothetical protein